jgi:hypothetical protein
LTSLYTGLRPFVLFAGTETVARARAAAPHNAYMRCVRSEKRNATSGDVDLAPRRQGKMEPGASSAVLHN